MAVDDGGRSPATLICPGCGGKPFPDARRLAVHLERHRDVQAALRDHATGRELSHACPAGCGRSFPSLVEFREHAPICDGRPPLPPLDETTILSPGGEARYRPLFCPECRIGIDEPERLGVHIERHREVGAPIFGRGGRVVSKPCPKGCGRHFPPKGEHDFRRHLQLCEGDAPIPVRRRDGKEPTGNIFGKREDGMFTCGECGKPLAKRNALTMHMKFKHPGSAAQPSVQGAAETTAPADGASGDDDGIVSRLKEKAGEHLKMAERIEELMKELETLL